MRKKKAGSSIFLLKIAILVDLQRCEKDCGWKNRTRSAVVGTKKDYFST